MNKQIRKKDKIIMKNSTISAQRNIAIVGAGAAGLMAAIEAGKNGHTVHVYDHAKKPGEKIRISGGGRCNFTNKYCTHENFIGQNKHFHKSALKRYPASDFISMVDRHKIAYHEKQPKKNTGQLFCDGRSQEIIDMLLDECAANNAQIHLETTIDSITKNDTDFTLDIGGKNTKFDAVIIATGGPSIPKMGASDFGYKIAQQFGHDIIPTEPALVPLTFTDDILNLTKSLSGVSIDSVLVRSDSQNKSGKNKKNQQTFTDDMLFTHRGLSGPAILQISSYWTAGDELVIDFCNGKVMEGLLKDAKHNLGKIRLDKFLNKHLPARFVEVILQETLEDSDQKINLGDLSKEKISKISTFINNWTVKPNGSEGYRTAEVTKGGVNTNEINSQTFESNKCDSLYFIGEVLDVTGHLGGHNFQWAWASGYCCGKEI